MKAILAGLLLLPALALGQATVAVPRLLPYQGRLLKADGTPESGTPRLTFCLYTAATGTSPLWCEDQNAPLRNGFYAIFLGSSTPFDASLFDGNPRWLGVAVDGAAEMTPRQQIASVAYAITSTYAVQASRASTASTAADALHAAEADHAASATVATNALHASTADTATRMPNADYAVEAGHAASAATAARATTAASADSATNAKTADEATHALTADTVTNIERVDYAVEAGHATDADTAGIARSADTFVGKDDLLARITALEAVVRKSAFGYVSPDGRSLSRTGPAGGFTVRVERTGEGVYQMHGTGIGDGVLLVTREMTGHQGDDIYVRVQRDGPDQLTVLFNANDSGMHDVGWYFHLMMP